MVKFLENARVVKKVEGLKLKIVCKCFWEVVRREILIENKMT